MTKRSFENRRSRSERGRMVCVMCHVVARVGEHCCRGLRDLLFSSASFETDWHSPATAKVTFFAQSAKKVSGIYHSSTRHSFFVVNICTLSISAAPTFCWMFPQLLLGWDWMRSKAACCRFLFGVAPISIVFEIAPKCEKIAEK